jgi:hypothetical protein
MMSASRSPLPHLVLLSVVALSLPACERSEAAISSAVVDTLANGAVRVRNTAEGAWAASGAPPWRLVEELRIGRVDGEGADVFGRIRNVFPDASGRIWVMDSGARELHLFDADGAFLRTVGRSGDGPGEISSNSCAYAGPDGEIWVEGGGRLQRFDTAGVLLGGTAITRNCSRTLWTSDGRFLVFTGAGSVEHRMTAAGELVAGDTFPAPSLPDAPTVTWRLPGARITLRDAVPFWPVAMWAESNTGDRWISDGGGPYAFRSESLAGDTLLLVERPYEPFPIEDATREEGSRREGWVADEPYSTDQVPRVYPPFDRIAPATDGTIWIFRTAAGGTSAVDVFAPDGVYLGAAGLPADFDRMDVRVVTGEHMYGIARDDLDVEYVVRLRIVRP